MAEVLASLKKIGGSEQYTETVLWTNPDPSSNFTGQNVTLSDSISNYKYIKFTWKTTTTDTSSSSAYVLSSDLASMTNSNGSRFLSLSSLWTNVYSRNITYNSATSVSIATSTRQGASGSNNGVNIPLEILGINELAHGKQHDNAIRIPHIYARLWSASNTALGGSQIILDGRDTVTIGSRDSAFSSCRADFYDVSDTLLEKNDIPVGGATYTAPANAYSVYIWGARNTAGQASISNIEIYKGE